MGANAISRPVSQALAGFTVKAAPEGQDKAFEDAKSEVARAIGRLAVPHGGRVERWRLARNQVGTITVVATVRFPGVQRSMTATTTALVNAITGSVVANQLREAIADAYGLATYADAKE